MKARTGKQSVAVVLAVSVACIGFVYLASQRVEDSTGQIDPKMSVLAPQ
jgi:hypothetical protein